MEGDGIRQTKANHTKKEKHLPFPKSNNVLRFQQKS
jgi:hypothetical protein